MMRGQQWTEDMDAELRKLHGSGISSSQIAAEMQRGLTRNAVIGRVFRLGMSRPIIVKKIAKARRQISQKPVVRVSGNGDMMKAYEAAEPDLRCAEVEPQNVSLVDLSSDGCRYPYGDGPFVFCNHKTIDGCAYCRPHFDLTRQRSRTNDEAVTEARRRRMRGINFRRALLEVAP